MIMTEFSSADFCRLSVQEVADLLLDKLDETGNDVSMCKVHGTDDSGRMYSLYLKMELFVDD